MKQLNSLLLTCFLLCSFALSAQISTNSQIWKGGLTLNANENGAGLYANPSVLHFLSPKFALGGQLEMLGDYDEGINKIFLAPEIRYYFNPEAQRTNWFAGLGSRIEAYSKEDNSSTSHLQIKPTIGNNLNLGGGLALENKLTTTFQGHNIDDFFQDPMLELSSSFVFLRDPLQEAEGQAVLPAIRQGSWMFGGDLLRASYHDLSAIRNLEISLSPSIGYFVSDRLLAGADLSLFYGHLKTDFTLAEQNFTRRSFGASISPYIRYYTAQTDKRVQPYLELRGNFGYTENILQGAGAGPSSFSRNVSASIGGGVDIFLTKNIALEAGLTLSRDFQNNNHQVGLQLGLKYFFSR